MIIVLDTSAGIEIVLKRSKSLLFQKYILEAKKVISSDLYKIEIANTLWKYIRDGLLIKNNALQLLNLAQELVDEYYEIEDFNEEAMLEAIKHNHSSYDMLYFTLARRTGALLLSLDKKLIKIAKNNSIETI